MLTFLENPTPYKIIIAATTANELGGRSNRKAS